jgi:hypothetical protein
LIFGDFFKRKGNIQKKIFFVEKHSPCQMEKICHQKMVPSNVFEGIFFILPNW